MQSVKNFKDAEGINMKIYNIEIILHQDIKKEVNIIDKDEYKQYITRTTRKYLKENASNITEIIEWIDIVKDYLANNFE